MASGSFIITWTEVAFLTKRIDGYDMVGIRDAIDINCTVYQRGRYFTMLYMWFFINLYTGLLLIIFDHVLVCDMRSIQYQSNTFCYK